MSRTPPAIVITDDRKQLWKWLESSMKKLGVPVTRIASTTTIPETENMFNNAPLLIIHWEANRLGGAIIDEILSRNPYFNLEKIIVILTAPTKEDIIYLSELYIRKVIHIRWHKQHLQTAFQQLHKFVKHPASKLAPEEVLLRKFSQILKNPRKKDADELKPQIIDYLDTTANHGASKIDLDACLHWLLSEQTKAHELWESSQKMNPQYPHAIEHQFLAYLEQSQYKSARICLKKLHHLNKNRPSRWIDLGNTHLEQSNFPKAESCFMEAMQRDPQNQKFVLTLANLKFLEEDYESARDLTRKTASTTELASLLNSEGIEYVKRGEYEKATKHYEKALLVLRNDPKSASIFYNLSLCLYRQNLYKEAFEMAQVTLIKEPDHEKALRLIGNLNTD